MPTSTYSYMSWNNLISLYGMNPIPLGQLEVLLDCARTDYNTFYNDYHGHFTQLNSLLTAHQVELNLAGYYFTRILQNIPTYTTTPNAIFQMLQDGLQGFSVYDNSGGLTANITSNNQVDLWEKVANTSLFPKLRGDNSLVYCYGDVSNTSTFLADIYGNSNVLHLMQRGSGARVWTNGVSSTVWDTGGGANIWLPSNSLLGLVANNTNITANGTGNTIHNCGHHQTTCFLGQTVTVEVWDSSERMTLYAANNTVNFSYSTARDVSDVKDIFIRDQGGHSTINANGPTRASLSSATPVNSGYILGHNGTTLNANTGNFVFVGDNCTININLYDITYLNVHKVNNLCVYGTNNTINITSVAPGGLEQTRSYTSNPLTGGEMYTYAGPSNAALVPTPLQLGDGLHAADSYTSTDDLALLTNSMLTWIVQVLPALPNSWN